MRRPLLDYVGVFGLSLMMMGAVVFCAGTSLWMLVGGLAMLGLLLPYGVLLKRELERQLLLAGGACGGVGLVWLWALLMGGTSGQWLWLFMLLLSVALLEVGVLRALRRVGMPETTSACVTAILWLLWFGAPVWLLHHLQTQALLPIMHGIIDIHPLFAINSIIRTPVWTESNLAYQILNLNQDVAYAMPAGSGWCTGVQGAAGLVLLWVGKRPE